MESNNKDIDFMGTLNIKKMLGFSELNDNNKVGDIISRSKLKLESLANVVTRGMGETPSKEDLYKRPTVSKDFVEKFTFESLKTYVEDVITTKKIGYQLMIDLERSKSSFSLGGKNSIGNALHKLAMITANRSESKSRLNNLKYALFNSGMLSKSFKESESDLYGQLIDFDGNSSGTPEQRAFGLFNIINRMSYLNVDNPVLKAILNDSSFIEDLSKLMGIDQKSGQALRDNIASYFKIDLEEDKLGSFFKKLKNPGTRFFGKVSDSEYIESAEGNKLDSNFHKRMGDYREQLFTLITSVLGKEDADGLRKALLAYSETLAASSEKNNSRFINYENIYKDFRNVTMSAIFEINKNFSDPNSIFFVGKSTGDDEKSKRSRGGYKSVFTRYINLSTETLKDLSRVSSDFELVVRTLVDKTWNRLTSSMDDDSLINIERIFKQLYSSDKEKYNE